MTHKHIFKIIGNGDYARGKALCTQIAKRLLEARAKHDWQGYIPLRAATVVCGEAAELEQAVRYESPERQHDEALDVLATAVRAYNQEWVVMPVGLCNGKAE